MRILRQRKISLLLFYLALPDYCSETNESTLMRVLLLSLVFGPIDCVKIWEFCGKGKSNCYCFIPLLTWLVGCRFDSKIILSFSAIIKFSRNCVSCYRLWPMRSALVVTLWDFRSMCIKKKHSENADTSKSVIFDMWCGPYDKVKNAKVI